MILEKCKLENLKG